jgi:hypothetical protein
VRYGSQELLVSARGLRVDLAAGAEGAGRVSDVSTLIALNSE